MTEKSMEERVALAIWRAREETMPGFTQRMTPDDLDRRPGGAWDLVRLQARAAIETMKQPSWRMRAAAQGKEGYRDIYGAMIDAALAEKEKADG